MKRLHPFQGSQLIMIGSCHSIMYFSPPFPSLRWAYLIRMFLPGCVYRYVDAKPFGKEKKIILVDRIRESPSQISHILLKHVPLHLSEKVHFV